MNCEQFENRVQQLLDERSNLSFDIQLQNHSRDCNICKAALNVYLSFAPVQESAIVPKVQIAEKRRSPVSLTWIVAAAALVLVSLFLIPEQRTTAPVAMLDSLSDVTIPGSLASAPNAELPNEPAMPSAITPPWYRYHFDLAGLWSNTVPSSLSGIPSVDLTSLGRMDLVAWFPNEPVRVVRSIPATIESIQPYYRYSTDVPVLNRWSSGINCTIGLIQSSLTYSTSDDLSRKRVKDFGHAMPADLRDLC